MINKKKKLEMQTELRAWLFEMLDGDTMTRILDSAATAERRCHALCNPRTKARYVIEIFNIVFSALTDQYLSTVMNRALALFPKDKSGERQAQMQADDARRASEAKLSPSIGHRRQQSASVTPGSVKSPSSISEEPDLQLFLLFALLQRRTMQLLTHYNTLVVPELEGSSNDQVCVCVCVEIIVYMYIH
jgi:hypothetical protein